MEKYPRLFIKAALIYLAIGTFLGFSYSLNYLEPLRFAHVHLNLFGFMAMFIFGIGYHVLPRFNAAEIKYPEMVRLHFYLSNGGLVGMVILHPVLPNPLYYFFLLTGVVSICLFVYNVYPLLADKKPQSVSAVPKAETPKPEVNEEKGETITADMRVRDVLGKYPGTLEIFVNAGLRSLANEEHRRNLPPVPIQMAAMKHGLDLNALLENLNSFVGKPSTISLKERPEITKGMMIGELLAAYPATKDILEKEYGASCFSCPGVNTETIEQTALMHNKNPDEILALIKAHVS